MAVKLVHSFPIDAPLTDVPARLRKLADQIDAGELEARIAIVVLVDNGEETGTHAFGDIGRSAEAIGWLVRAMRGI